MKPIVRYARGSLEYEARYSSARLFALDHPLLGMQDVRTSRVIYFEEATGRLETLNTVYIPEEESNVTV